MARSSSCGIKLRIPKSSPSIWSADYRSGRRSAKSTISYCTPVIWDTPSGKQVVAAGHARMTGYDLKSGEEKWSAAGMPSGCCASPVTADGILYFAGWSPGGEDDPENAVAQHLTRCLRTWTKISDEALSREEAEKAFEGFFDNQDQNKDG